MRTIIEGLIGYNKYKKFDYTLNLINIRKCATK